MSAITVLAVGGTGESYDGDARERVTGMLSGVTTALDVRFIPRWVGYPASYGPAPRMDGISYTDSVAEGVRRLDDALGETDGPVAIIGYSQGAVVIRTLLNQLAADEEASVAPRADLDRIVAVGFIADPHQPPGAVGDCSGWGVAGPGLPLPAAIPARWIGSADDVICNASADSFIRDIADLTGSLSLQALPTWTSEMWKLLRTNAFQNAGHTSVNMTQWRTDLRRLVRAAREVRGYLPAVLYRSPSAQLRRLVIRNVSGGRHTSYLSEGYGHAAVTGPDITGCQELARWLQVEATFAADYRTVRRGAAGGVAVPVGLPAKPRAACDSDIAAA